MGRKANGLSPLCPKDTASLGYVLLTSYPHRIAILVGVGKKIDSKKGYYDTLKHCGISKSDINFYETNFPKEQFVELLAISSLNGSGYVREKAVKKLSQVDSSKAIQFLIYRLADWVLPVRHAALKGIDNYKTTNYIDSLIENLPISPKPKLDHNKLNFFKNVILVKLG